MPREFPPRLKHKFDLTEGGGETELLYKWGLELPEFSMLPLFDDPQACEIVRAMYCRYFDAAEKHGTGMLILGHDYRASPDWGAKLGYSAEKLAEMERRRKLRYSDWRQPDAHIRGPLALRSQLARGH